MWNRYRTNDVTRLKTHLDELYVKVTSLRNRKESSKDPTQDSGGASGPAADPSAAQSIIRKGFRRRMAVKKLFFKKGNGAKRLRYAKLHKNWAKNLWQQILKNDESKFSFKSSTASVYSICKTW